MVKIGPLSIQAAPGLGLVGVLLLLPAGARRAAAPAYTDMAIPSLEGIRLGRACSSLDSSPTSASG